MPKSLPTHVDNLLNFLAGAKEKANEDLAIAYFRQAFGDAFTRQEEAGLADGYVPGSFVLELKGDTKDWLSGLFQGLAYKNKGLDFNQIVVGAQNFLAVWKVSDLPEDICDVILLAKGAPNRIGASFSKRYANRRTALLKLAIWNGAELTDTLFQQPASVLEKIKSFEKTIEEGRKVRLKITLKNFTSVLKEMKVFFDQTNPVKTVRGFFSMLYGWNNSATIQLSDKTNHKATLGGETITDLIPAKRRQFKDYVETRYIHLSDDEDNDDFFARYDEALDAVDKDFRIKHGIFFTDRDLSKFVMWLVKQHIPNLGKNYLVIDPACGSGNLVTNWRSPLELRHKVVSEIEPELLFAVEKRMDGDQWHNGKFTVVPKVEEGRGLNFLDVSAHEYLDTIRKYLAAKGHNPDRPIAFLCNPPFRNDDDQTAKGSGYEVHESIRALTGRDASSERYSCFLAQMKLICEAARSNGLPDNSLLLLFTKTSWLTKRGVFGKIRTEMLGAFNNVTGVVVDSREFFDVKGSWPLAFSVWRYKAKNEHPDPLRIVEFKDLTWMKKEHLAQIAWDDPQEMEKACSALLAHPHSKIIGYGEERTSIKDWTGGTRKDFQRNRRKNEINKAPIGGLPIGDHRHANRKAYGEADGKFIGFMDDLTLCRLKNSILGGPWFRLDIPLMDIKKNRCLSGPPSQKGFFAFDLASAERLFFWYALGRTLLQHPYPKWIDAEELWEPNIPDKLERSVFQMAFAIAYAENECVQARFPANNPVNELPELHINNPMTPLDPDSFWSKTLLPYCATCASKEVNSLLKAVDKFYDDWKRTFKGQTELPLSRRPYLLDDNGVKLGAGLVQIRAYAIEAENEVLLTDWSDIQKLLISVRTSFFDMVNSKSGLNYFGIKKKAAASAVAGKNGGNKALA